MLSELKFDIYFGEIFILLINYKSILIIAFNMLYFLEFQKALLICSISKYFKRYLVSYSLIFFSKSLFTKAFHIF